MPEPVVPVINPSILKTKPKPSGICPTNTKLLLFLVLPLGGVLIGVVAHFLGIVVGLVGVLIAAAPNLLTGLCGAVMCIGVIFAIVVILFVVFGYPAGVGMVIGQIVYVIGKKGNCRAPGIAGAAGLLTGITAYAGHLVTAYLLTRTLHIMTITSNGLMNSLDINISGTPWWMYLLMVIELVLIMLLAWYQAHTETENDMFCEPHGVWYAPWKEASYPIELAPAIAETLEAAQVRSLENVTFLEGNTFPNLKVRFRRCPSSSACELQLKVDLNWQEEKIDKKGQKSTENKTKVWVDTMVTPSLGFALENALRLDEAKLIKKKKDK